MDHTHNDYLEFLVEFGLVGGLFLAGFVLCCILRAARGLEDRSRPGRFGISFASLMVSMITHIAPFEDRLKGAT